MKLQCTKFITLRKKKKLTKIRNVWKRAELTVLLGAPSETFSDDLETQRERERERERETERVCVF